MTFMGIGMLTISTYCGFLYASYTREVNQSQSLTVPQDVSDRYNHTASTFDADVDMSEKLMRLGRKRHDLIQMARGNVLEVSCGTGRNLAYYDLSQVQGQGQGQGAERGQGYGQGQGQGLLKGCRSVTFIDLSSQMVEVTRQKFERMYPRFVQRVSFAVADAGVVNPSVAAVAAAGAAKPRYFDTIVQTMGLCSMPDPVGTLRHLGSITEPQHGRILLLEHGRSYYDWLNRVLDNLAPAHADRHGCWWNRDIGKIVRDSGLEVVEEKRWHFGTTWRYVLRPRPKSG